MFDLFFKAHKYEADDKQFINNTNDRFKFVLESAKSYLNSLFVFIDL